MISLHHTWQRIRGGTKQLVSSGVELVLPRVCLLCQCDLSPAAAEADFCDVCKADMVATSPLCLGCGAEISPALPPADHCVECHDSRFKFSRTVSLGSYTGTLRAAILRTKELAGQPTAISLTRLLAVARGQAIEQFEPHVVLPIPLHWSRRWARGYNNAQSSADVLARWLGIPLAGFLLRRTRLTRPQSELPPSSRRSNIRGAFHVMRHPDLNGARVLIVDDILTTGATCQEAAKTLLAAGASEIMVAVWARAIH